MVPCSPLTVAQAHVRDYLQGHSRKDGVTPLADHARRVVANLQAIGVTDEEELIAAAFHDLEEDLSRMGQTQIRISRIADDFGPRVRKLVDEQQEKRFDELNPTPTRDEERRLRYAELLGHVDTWDAASCRIKVCDVAANLILPNGPLDPHCPQIYRQFHLTYTLPALFKRLKTLGEAIDEHLLQGILGQAYQLPVDSNNSDD